MYIWVYVALNTLCDITSQWAMEIDDISKASIEAVVPMLNERPNRDLFIRLKH